MKPGIVDSTTLPSSRISESSPMSMNFPSSQMWVGAGFETRRRAKNEVIDWLLWYNSRRLHSTLGYLSPMQYEQRWLARQAKTANM